MFKNILLVSVFTIGLTNAKPPIRELFPDTITPPPAPTPFSGKSLISFNDYLSDSEQGSVVYTKAAKPKSPKAFKRLEEAMSYNFVYQFAIDFEEEKRMSLEAVKRMKPGYLDLDELFWKLKQLSGKPQHEQGSFDIFSRVSESD